MDTKIQRYKEKNYIHSFHVSLRPLCPAFTLAEVLITLAIIGVVAALTIPVLYSNYLKTQYVTQLKKAYTQFNQALIQMAADYGCTGDLKCTGLFDTDTDNQSLGTELVKYFKVTKNCETTSTECLSEYHSEYYDGHQLFGNSIGNYIFVTSDGMSFMVINSKNNCEAGFTGNTPLSQYCGDLVVDVNGLNGPNYIGRDIFYFYITNGQGPLLYPGGGEKDVSNGYWKDADGNPVSCYDGDKQGFYCAGRIMDENWQMNY